jgi:hypothetical protein
MGGELLSFFPEGESPAGPSFFVGEGDFRRDSPFRRAEFFGRTPKTCSAPITCLVVTQGQMTPI